MATVEGGHKLDAVLRDLGKRHGQKTEARAGFLETATYPDGTPVAMVAALNNFGAPEAGIPARPFFSDMIRAKSPYWSDQFAEIVKACDGDTDEALAIMGESIAGQLREAIQAFNSVPNSPVTDLLKQRFPKRDGMTYADVVQARRDVAAGATAPAGKPLVWSGDMFDNVGSDTR